MSLSQDFPCLKAYMQSIACDQEDLILYNTATYINLNNPCVCVCVSYDISEMERHITMFLLPPCGEHSICLSPWLPCMIYTHVQNHAHYLQYSNWECSQGTIARFFQWLWHIHPTTRFSLVLSASC